jgi:hypothetical protein
VSCVRIRLWVMNFWFTRDDEWNGEGTSIWGFSHGFLSRKSTALYVHTVPGTDSNRFIKILLGDDLAGLFFGSLVRQDVPVGVRRYEYS